MIRFEVTSEMERLQKVLAQAGVASRRKCEELIQQGRVEVNDLKVTELGTKVDPRVDLIKVDGRAVKAQNHIYLLFNKPKGVITSVSDPKGRKVVTDFLKDVRERVYPVGRLDYDTEGLLLLTNDGEFANWLMHPRHQIPKTYLATVKGIPHGSQLEKLANGIMLDDGMTAPAEVEYHDIDPDGKTAVLSITIHEGRNRQVRRMLEAIGYPITRLKRIRYGTLGLDGLQRGKYRQLTPQEIKELMKPPSAT